MNSLYANFDEWRGMARKSRNSNLHLLVNNFHKKYEVRDQIFLSPVENELTPWGNGNLYYQHASSVVC